jgi:electron transport complex protein RnfC
MAKLTFRGGIHPFDGKDLSKSGKVQTLMPGKELAYPLSQHIGAPASPLVKKGDRVLAGQKIAEGAGFVSVPIHASVSGVVKALEPRRVATGDLLMSIIVENDGLYEQAAFTPLGADATGEAIRTAVREAGIVGMGGAGFPAAVKLSPKEPDKIEYVIGNCAECEPYLTSDYRRMLEEPERIIGGLKTVLKLFPNAVGILGVEDNKPDAIKILQKAAAGEDKIFVKTLKTKYPQGAERQLIFAVTGRKISSANLPSDVGCIVHNADTLTAIYRAITEGRPLMERVVTVTGGAIVHPCNFRVKIGTNFREICEAAGGFTKTPEKIVCGGPMMGFSMFDLDVPVTKTSTALLALTEEEAREGTPGACINCGRCVEVCPGRVMPNKLATAAEYGEEEKFLKLQGMECCECGCCSFICPAKRPLTQWIKSMRKMELAKRKR